MWRVKPRFRLQNRLIQGAKGVFAPHKHARAVYEPRDGEVTRRRGRRLAHRIPAQLELIPGILAARGSFPVLCAQKRAAAPASEPPVKSRFC